MAAETTQSASRSGSVEELWKDTGGSERQSGKGAPAPSNKIFIHIQLWSNRFIAIIRHFCIQNIHKFQNKPTPTHMACRVHIFTVKENKNIGNVTFKL